MKFRSSRSLVLLGIVTVFLTGCPMVDWKELNFARSKPKAEALVGVWTPAKETQRDIQQKGHYREAEHKIMLRKDGGFSIVNMPDWRNGFGKLHGEFTSSSGTWTLETDPKPNWLSTWRIALRYPDTFDWGFDVYRQKPPYLIFVRIGDPNDGFGMFYERSSTTILSDIIPHNPSYPRN